MNLRKTITGAAVALGSATVMLGLGGVAHAAGPAEASAETNPNLPLQVGDAASAGDLASVNTDDEAGKIQAANLRDMNVVDAAANNLDADVIANALGYDATPDQPGHVHVNTAP
ncbi:hypothetical protein Lesp02_48210 [Lentzea sp. NBRC 105346]|uniref:hypothetical protein n=1 Tax=Lentzea sp. NBRC 105346 TaxID=3032205 RepID=UPI0024A3EBB5|nr:hypothetical protein [Lentzea sp. NBRC 105346]GLZ32633.1 hypothetical protein Lesp02_48210 [Lentzea sp. NBRC 105346]